MSVPTPFYAILTSKKPEEEGGKAIYYIMGIAVAL